MSINAARQRFIDEYLAAPANVAEAARRAGYSPRRAKETACELLKLPAVRERVAAGQAAIRGQRSLDRDRLSERLLALCQSENATGLEVVRAVRQLALLHGLYPCQCAVRKAPGRAQGPFAREVAA